MLRPVIGFTIAIVLLTTGCSGFQELSIEQRNRNAAYCAWKRVRSEYQQQGVPYRVREHVGAGFQQGYYDVSMGGNGQVPLFPPNVYWGVKYQNEQGSAAIGAWFRGYQDGAIAAEKDGLASFNQIPSSWAPPPQPGDPSGALTRGEFDGDEQVPAVPTVPPMNTMPMNVPMQQPPSELPPLLQPETPASTLPVLPVPTPPTLPNPGLPTTPNAVPNSAVPKSAVPGTPMPTVPVPGTTVPPTPVLPVPVPGATPGGTPLPKPRDPVGGRQTLLLPGNSPTPTAQLSLFGKPAETNAVEIVR